MGFFKEAGKFFLLGPIGYVIHRKSKADGYKEGHNDGEELSKAELDEIRKKLQELQQQREKTKDGFQEVISSIAEIDLKDENFFSKIASLFRGYTVFHVYVISCVSYARYQIQKNKLSDNDAEDLKHILLGLIAAGFPKNLKKDVDLVWASTDANEVMTTYHKYRGKLDKAAVVTLDDTIININDYIKQFAALIQQEHKFEKIIAAA
ncbi:hypothetical protein FACS1894142_2980 [Spirochaetia bacterium]|nr:hypothetical protein FACS1894142_2980 [Spirochaetia bacterium]